MAIARRPHPFSSRTRQLSSSAPMVLRWQRRGRVGRCPIQLVGRPGASRCRPFFLEPTSDSGGMPSWPPDVFYPGFGIALSCLGARDSRAIGADEGIPRPARNLHVWGTITDGASSTPHGCAPSANSEPRCQEREKTSPDPRKSSLERDSGSGCDTRTAPAARSTCRIFPVTESSRLGLTADSSNRSGSDHAVQYAGAKISTSARTLCIFG